MSLFFKIGLIFSGCQVNVGAQDPPPLFQQQPYSHLRTHRYYKLSPWAARTQATANQHITFPFTTVIGSSMGRWLKPGQSELPPQASWKTDGELDSHPAPPHPVSTQLVLNQREGLPGMGHTECKAAISSRERTSLFFTLNQAKPAARRPLYLTSAGASMPGVLFLTT